VRGETVADLLERLTEGELFELMMAAASRHGWAGTMFTRSDVESTEFAVGDGEDYVRPTPVMVAAVMDSRTWRKAIPERACERGFEAMYDALVINPDGSFAVDGGRFTADGDRVG
jgi:hypothetical protein